MNCNEVQKKLSPYMDKEIDHGQSKMIEDHLNQCPICLKEFEILKKTDACLKGIPHEELSKEFHRKLFQEMEALSLPVDHEAHKRRPVWSVDRMMDRILALFRQPRNPWTMNAFGDFPPWTLGHAYMKLIEQNQ